MGIAWVTRHQRIATDKKDLESLLRNSEGRDLGFLVGDRSTLCAHQRKASGDHDRQRSDDEDSNRHRKPTAFGVVRHIVKPLGKFVRFLKKTAVVKGAVSFVICPGAMFSLIPSR